MAEGKGGWDDHEEDTDRQTGRETWAGEEGRREGGEGKKKKIHLVKN